MKRTSIGAGAYVDEQGEYWARPTINRRRTWRKLSARSDKKAIKEANSTEFTATADTFAALATLWIDSGCPGKKRKAYHNHEPEKARADILVKYFGKYRCDEIRMKDVPGYATWRRKLITRKTNTGGRTVDLEMVTLSNILRFGVMQGHLEFNYIRADRPRYAENVRHAREVMPESAEVIHQVAVELLSNVRSEVHAWHAFFAEFTGCRTSELLRLRLDAKNKTDAGYIEWLTADEIKNRADDIVGHLYLGRRSKNGLNPWARIGAEFSEMIRAFQNWHKERYKSRAESFFPGNFKDRVVEKGSFGHAITRVTGELGLPHITPHGFRAFYATKRLRDGARPVEIAAEMGDKTVSLVENIYADNAAGKKLWWTPADGLPAWHGWLSKRIGLKLDYGQKQAKSKVTKPA